MLTFKTRGNTVPTGKDKIYVAAHPADYSQYMDACVNMILQVSNTAVYYDDNHADLYRAERFIDEYKIVVFLVTKQFLCESNYAKDVLLELALKKKMAILPITFDSDTGTLFSKMIGEYHCLYAGLQTGTEKYFYKKLSDFIENNLAPDDIKTLVRKEAFDSFLFISYRKVDRAYVNEYVKMIHSNPRLQGIGFWYDEELTFGNDYNEEIEAALTYSDIFLMVVTPNLIEGDNYVKRVEYKLALETGKPIIAVELVPTDKEKFFEVFPEVDAFVPLQNVADALPLFMRVLQGGLRSELTRRELYMLGMAYTFGISVETDYEKGRSFLEQSASLEFVPAIEKLIEIYENRIGIAFNQKKVLMLKKTSAEIKGRRFAEERTQERFLDYIHGSYLYGDELFMAEQYGQACEVLEEVEKLCKLNNIGCEDLMPVYHLLGKFWYQIKRNFAKADDYFERQIDMTAQYIEQAGGIDKKAGENLCAAFILKGDIRKSVNDMEGAEKQYLAAKKVAINCDNDFPCNDSLRNLAAAHSRLAELYQECYVKTKFEDFFRLHKQNGVLSAEYSKKAYWEIPTMFTLLNYIQNEMLAADAFYADMEFDEAVVRYSKITHAASKLREDYLPDVSDFVFLKSYAIGLERVYEYLSDALKKIGRTEEAETCYNLAVEMQNILANNQ